MLGSVLQHNNTSTIQCYWQSYTITRNYGNCVCIYRTKFNYYIFKDKILCCFVRGKTKRKRNKWTWQILFFLSQCSFLDFIGRAKLLNEDIIDVVNYYFLLIKIPELYLAQEKRKVCQISKGFHLYSQGMFSVALFVSVPLALLHQDYFRRISFWKCISSIEFFYKVGNVVNKEEEHKFSKKIPFSEDWTHDLWIFALMPWLLS